MNEKDWDKRFLDLLKQKAEEIKSETQRLVEEVRDPETQRRMKERLREFGTWAKQAAEEAAERLESAIKKAETAFTQRLESPPDSTHTQAPTDAEGTTPTQSPPRGSVSRRGSPKTVGKSKAAAAGEGRAQRTAKKTIGKRK